MILTDHIMPGTSGLVFVRQVRELCPDIPVLVISGMFEVEGEYSGFDITFLRKPYRPESLIREVQAPCRATGRLARGLRLATVDSVRTFFQDNPPFVPLSLMTMKTMTCKSLGGPCEQKLSADSWNEMVSVMTRHVIEQHPDTAKAMEKMHNEDPKKWGRETKPKWDAAPES